MGTPLRDYVIGGILFTLCITIVFASITMLDQGDPLTDGGTSITSFADDDSMSKFNRSFNKIDALVGNVSSLHDSIKQTKPVTDTSIVSLGAAFVSSIFGAVRVIIFMIPFMDSVYDGFIAHFGIPIFVGTIIKMIAIVFLVFAIISLIFGKDT